jgi:hypothetical protein
MAEGEEAPLVMGEVKARAGERLDEGDGDIERASESEIAQQASRDVAVGRADSLAPAGLIV